MSQDVEQHTPTSGSDRSVGSDGLAAGAIALLTLAIIITVIIALV